MMPANAPISLQYAAGGAAPSQMRAIARAVVHPLALLAAAATFPLIFMGGLVTSHGAGLAVPDWPNSFGYNMFLFPVALWQGNIWYEHTHRLAATVVGSLSILLCLSAWLGEDRRWVRWLGTAVLGGVILQGVIGGLRVVLLKLNLAMVHACMAQAFFCLAAFMALAASRWWKDARDLSGDSLRGRTLVRWGLLTFLLVFAQLVIAATMRHSQAGLAIPDLPLAYGKLLPPTGAAGLSAANHARLFEYHLADPVTLAQIWLHFAHRIGAVVVTLSVGGLVFLVIRSHRDQRSLAAGALVLLTLLAGQVVLGVVTVLYRKPADIASAHVATGALLLITSFLLTACAARLYRLNPVAMSQDERHPARLESPESPAGLAWTAR